MTCKKKTAIGNTSHQVLEDVEARNVYTKISCVRTRSSSGMWLEKQKDEEPSPLLLSVSIASCF